MCRKNQFRFTPRLKKGNISYAIANRETKREEKELGSGFYKLKKGI